MKCPHCHGRGYIPVSDPIQSLQMAQLCVCHLQDLLIDICQAIEVDEEVK